MSRDDWSGPLHFPFSVGAVLAANAVPDAYLLMDAPGCALWRPGFVQGSHDWNSRLWRTDGFHRVQTSMVSVERLAMASTLPEIGDRLARMAARPDCGVVMATGFPLVMAAGVPHPAAWKAIRPPPTVPFVNVRPTALNADWLDGYAAALDAMARAHPLRTVPRRADAVGIVGYLHDRNERDHAGNHAELRRLLAALGLDLVSTWLDGSPFADLGRIAEAGTLLAFPYARDAACTLAKRLGGLPIIECGVPFGLKGTADWLRSVGVATGRETQAETLIEAELRRVVPRVGWAIEPALRHGRAWFRGDPHLVRPLAGLLAEVGVQLVGAVAVAGEHHEAALGPWDDVPCAVRFAPSMGWMDSMLAAGEARFGDQPVDCAIGWHEPPRRFVGLGFPSPYAHALVDRPFLGFEGCLHFIDRLAGELGRAAPA